MMGRERIRCQHIGKISIPNAKRHRSQSYYGNDMSIWIFFFLLRIWMRIMKTNFEWPQASWREHSAVTGTWNQSQINWFQNWNLFTMQLIFFGRITLLWQVRHSVLTAYDERGLFTKRIADENSFVPILVAAIDYTSSHAQLIFPFINLFLSAIVEHKQWPYTVRTCMQLYGYGMVGER